jgi:PIN domain nuclease of toxin-antitoxin system
MKLLLDTHALLWFVSNHPDLSPTAAQLIGDPANQKIVSIVSLWEITIKVSLGRLNLALPLHITIAIRSIACWRRRR